jgi:hypothetical protein
MNLIATLLAAILIPICISAQNAKSSPNNSLSKKEIKQGWQLLFDGNTLDGWKGYNSDKMFSCWSVADGELVCLGEGGSETAGDIITLSDFDTLNSAWTGALVKLETAVFFTMFWKEKNIMLPTKPRLNTN